MKVPVVHEARRDPRAARENREALDQAGCLCVNLIGSTGCGKTALLETIIPRLQASLRVGVIEGDLTTTCDAERVAALETPVVKVLTDGDCRLTAEQVQAAMGHLPLGALDLVIVENTGSVVCQAATDLGEHLRVAVMSVTAGDNVARKYPLLYREASLVLLTKFDLMPQVDFALDETVRTIGRVNGRAEIICTDARKRIGIDRAAGWLAGYARAQRMQARTSLEEPELELVP